MATDDSDKEAAIEYFLKDVRSRGAAVRSVSDGHILMFKRKTLQALLDADPDKDELVIFLKTPDKN